MILQSRRVWVNGRFAAAQLTIENGRIARVGPYDERPAGRDYGALRIVPGFIDIHTHGAFGYDANSGDAAQLLSWARRLPGEGVTAFLPTLYTDAGPRLLAGAAAAGRAARAPREGAEILGIHMEGPFLNAAFKGAQPAGYIEQPSLEAFERYQAAAGGAIRLLTLAPEQDADLALTRHAAASGVVVSLGHSAASFAQANAAFSAGASSVTHMFNAMSPFHHRAPGLVGAALLADSAFAEVVGDGHHVDFAAVRLLARCKGKDRLVLVTDSLPAKGLRRGQYEFAGQPYEIAAGGYARLLEGKTIAGSTLAMNRGLQNLVERAGLSFGAALAACAANPARLMGVSDRKGKLEEGYDADLVVLGDDYSVAECYCRGALQA